MASNSSFATAEINDGIPRDGLLAIAGRSAEFQAVNTLLNQGAKLSNVVLGTVVFHWPAEGPTILNELYQKGCQEKSSASTGGEMFSRDPAHWN